MATVMVRTSELNGPALDWAVAKCEGYHDSMLNVKTGIVYGLVGELNFSTDLRQGGRIIYQELIHVGPVTYGPAAVMIGRWYAIIGFDPDNGDHLYESHGDTPLVAAMRCYVLSKFGDEIEVPIELI